MLRLLNKFCALVDYSARSVGLIRVVRRWENNDALVIFALYNKINVQGKFGVQKIGEN